MTSNLGSRIKLAVQVFLKGSAATNLRHEIPAITAEEVAEAKQFFPLEKFFIFGHARSGTTLLARLIRLHPEVHCNWQAHFFTRAPMLKALVEDEDVGAWLGRRSNRWNHGRDLSPVVLRATADFILERDARLYGKRIVGDKSPNSLYDGEAVRLLHAVYPDARLIFIVRDGRDTVVSHRLQGFIDAAQHLTKEDLRIREEFAHHPEAFLYGKRSIFSGNGIRRAAEGWVKNMVETNREGRVLFGDQYLSLRYEDLLKQPWEEMERVWSFLGAKLPLDGLEQEVEKELRQNPDADWQQQKAGELVKTIKKGQQGFWREMFTSKDRKIFDEVAGETLKVWGYDN